MRRVSQQGSLRWQGQRTFISELVAYETLGLRPLDDRYRELLYGPVSLGYFDTFEHTFHRVLPLHLRRRRGPTPAPDPL